MKLTIRVDREVLRQARIRALREGTTVTAVVRDCLESYAEGPSRRRTAMDRFLALSQTASTGRGDATWTRHELHGR